MSALTYRLFLTCLNIFFPPLAIMLLCGASWDCMLNCALFLLAIIPSHVHGFYLTCIYFHRRRKVRKGRYPGGPKPMVFSQHVLNGGASDAVIEELWRNENGLPRKGRRRDSGSAVLLKGDSESRVIRREGSHVRRTGSSRRNHHSRARSSDGLQSNGRRNDV